MKTHLQSLVSLLTGLVLAPLFCSAQTLTLQDATRIETQRRQDERANQANTTLSLPPPFAMYTLERDQVVKTFRAMAAQYRAEAEMSAEPNAGKLIARAEAYEGAATYLANYKPPVATVEITGNPPETAGEGP